MSIKLNKLKEELKIFGIKINEVVKEQEREVSRIKETFSEQVIPGRVEEVKNSFLPKEQELRKSMMDSLESTLLELNNTIDNKVAGELKETDMMDITLLEGMENISERELRLYVNKHKENMILLKRLFEIGEKHGLHVTIGNLDGIDEAIKDIEKRVTDFITTYNPNTSGYSHGIIVDGDFLNRYQTQIENGLDTQDVKVIKIGNRAS